MTFPHPETGELLDSREDFLRAVTNAEERLTPVYKTLWRLRAEYAVRFDAALIPSARYRSVTQEKVSRCPRCHGKLESEEAAE